jgi:hypothetical protein
MRYTHSLVRTVRSGKRARPRSAPLTFSGSTSAATAADRRSDPARRRSDGSGNGSAPLRPLRGSNAQAVINYLWKVTYKCWPAFSHTNKPTSWVIARYFGMFNKARNDRWVFGDRHSGAYRHRFSWTNIARHQIVTGRPSPDDPALNEYWAAGRRKTPMPVNKAQQRLYRAQDGRCYICSGNLPVSADRPRTHLRSPKTPTGLREPEALRGSGQWTREGRTWISFSPRAGTSLRHQQ